MTKGWTCPNCGKGLAPWKASCNCVKAKKVTKSSFELCAKCMGSYMTGSWHKCADTKIDKHMLTTIN
jgi:hypothetical protein